MQSHPMDLPLYLMTFGISLFALGIVTKQYTVLLVGFTLWLLMAYFGLIKYIFYVIQKKEVLKNGNN